MLGDGLLEQILVLGLGLGADRLDVLAALDAGLEEGVLPRLGEAR